MQVPALEAIAPSAHSQLHLYYPGSMEGGGEGGHQPTRFAWMVDSIVYHGELDMQVTSTHTSVNAQAVPYCLTPP